VVQVQPPPLAASCCRERRLALRRARERGLEAAPFSPWSCTTTGNRDVHRRRDRELGARAGGAAFALPSRPGFSCTYLEPVGQAAASSPCRRILRSGGRAASAPAHVPSAPVPPGGASRRGRGAASGTTRRRRCRRVVVAAERIARSRPRVVALPRPQLHFTDRACRPSSSFSCSFPRSERRPQPSFGASRTRRRGHTSGTVRTAARARRRRAARAVIARRAGVAVVAGVGVRYEGNCARYPCRTCRPCTGCCPPQITGAPAHWLP
jgi:hypothetical protein